MRAYLASLAVAIPALLAGCSSNTATTPPATDTPAVLANPVGAAAVDTKRILAADSEPGSWLMVGRDYKEQRYSTLNKINTDNVSKLGLVWYGDVDTERGQESTPVVVDGVMYITSAWSMVKAYDIKTGAKLWEYDPKIDRAKGADACCDVVNRGVAAWEGKIYLGALDGRLIALDSKTGAVVWSEQTTPVDGHHTITGAPRVANGKVFIGNGGAEYDVRGYVSAFDANTGKPLWRWYTVPGDPSKPYENDAMKMAAKTWKGDVYWTLGGGATAWDAIVYDEKTNLVYFGTGNGLSWAQEIRSPGGGDNLFVSSIVALNADTGEYAWHYQETPGDEWDYDNCNPLMIADLPLKGGKTHVVMQASKNGFYYILDAKSGKLLSAEKYVPETNWATKIDMTTGRPVENPEARYSKNEKPVIIWPAALGMHNWHPMAFSPETGYVYIPVTVSNAPYSAQDDFKFNPKGWNTGTDFAGGADLYKQPGAPAVRGNVTSYILAWDPVNAKEVWRIPNKEYGATGVMTTAGNLLFSGNHNGEFVAYNATTGDKLWSAPTQARVVAAPSTYTVDGQQQVAVLVGARGLPPGQSRTSAVSANNSRILVFAPGGAATLPATVSAGAATGGAKIDPPLLTANNETVAAGEQAYLANCSACHGRTAVPGAGSIGPDLRYTALLRDEEQFKHAVLDGDRAQRGMPGFKTTLRDGEAESILAYLIKRANDEKAAQEAGKAN
jgi:quinohemoprotein ethanol dehydrogenase